LFENSLVEVKSGTRIKTGPREKLVYIAFTRGIAYFETKFNMKYLYQENALGGNF